MNKAKHVQYLISTAADLALEQAQATDDFFLPGRGYNIEDVNSVVKIKMQKGSRFEDVPVFEALYGISGAGVDDKERIFMNLYDTPDFKNFAKGTGNIKSSVLYYNHNQTGLQWYKVPKIARVGLDVTGMHSNITTVTYPQGGIADKTIADMLFADFGMFKAKNIGVFNGVAEDYYYPPLSLGITYLNPDLLNMLFMNNIDLLMRSKYIHFSLDLTSEEGGNGLFKGIGFNDLIDDSRIRNKNPINDGLVTYVRGDVKTNYNGFKTYTGIPPKIEYKVIDMYDSRNDKILTMLFGANTVADDGRRFSSKAEYLKYIDRNVIDPATGLPYESKPIVVAKITFYADFIIPYTMLVSRDFKGNLDPSAGNLLALDIKNTTGVKGYSGNDCFSYTRYFAVTP